MRPQLLAVWVLGACAVGCVGAGFDQDAGTSDAGTSDAGANDAGRSDAGITADAGTPADAGNNAITVTISPKTASVALTGSRSFTCSVSNTANTACTWNVVTPGGGTITSAGLYTAPATGSTAQVSATSVADPSKSDTATIGLVAPCSGLAGQVGVWQNISPPAFSSPSNVEAIAVVVNPLTGTVFATASNWTNGGNPQSSSGILRSNDCGATWAVANDQTPGSNSARLSTGNVWGMVIDSDVPSTMYAVNGYGELPTIHKSTDHGVHWIALDPDPTKRVSGTFVQAIGMNPRNHQHLAVTFHLGCGTAAPFSWCFSYSKNGGTTWTVFDGPTSIPHWDIPTAGWVEGTSIAVLGTDSYLIQSAAGLW